MNVDDEYKKVFEYSLDLHEPWQITEIKFDSGKIEFVVDIGIQENAVFSCPHCGGSAVRDGFEPTERSWRHLDFLMCKCYVHCLRPRVKCYQCGVQQISAPFERKHSRHTRLFEYNAFRTMKIVSRSKASELLSCNEKTLESIYSYWSNLL